MLRMSLPVAVLMAGAQIILGIVDGIRDLKQSYHPIQDIRTYLAWRKRRAYDDGGWIQPGPVITTTSKPEPLLNPSQWRKHG